MTAGNVYPLPKETVPRSLFGRPTRKGYRAAVKEIILEVQARHNLNDGEFAEVVGVCEDTIENARKEACDLSVLTLLNIAYAFGEEAIEPVRQLYLCAPAEQISPAERIRSAQRVIDHALAEMEQPA